jgi:C2H2 type zinc-finger (2 copies)
VACPFCGGAFTTASGVSHHLETSSCPSARNLNRDALYKALRARDQHGLITKKLLQSKELDTIDTYATFRTWNGYAYECYLCHRDFHSLRALNQHLNSPAHQQKYYHCPNKRGCGKDFVTLAALFNHLESESCGFMRFENVNKSANEFLTGKKMITF